jgi:hypothetical protein
MIVNVYPSRVFSSGLVGSQPNARPVIFSNRRRFLDDIPSLTRTRNLHIIRTVRYTTVREVPTVFGKSRAYYMMLNQL